MTENAPQDQPETPGTPLTPPTVRDADEKVVSEDRVTVRRAPRITRFLILGAGLGAIATFILTALYPIDQKVGFGPLFGYFLLFGIPAGAALGGIIASVLDIISTRRSKSLTAERSSAGGSREL